MNSSTGDKRTAIGKIEAILCWLGRSLVIGLLGYSPWLYGMVSWPQHVILFYWTMCISAVTILCLVLRKASVPGTNLLLACLLGLLVLGIAQTIPLPKTVFDSVSAARKFELLAVQQAAKLVPVDESELLKSLDSESQHEMTLSIYPIQTRCSLAVFSCAIAILLCSSILFRDKLSRIVLLICLSATSTAVALLGILQSVSWNSWTLLAMPGPTHFATFVSRNSAPQYLAVGIGCTLALVGVWKRRKDKLRQKNYHRRYPATTVIAKVRQVLEDLILELDAVMIILLTVLVAHIVAVVATASRGGFVSLLFSAAVCVLFFLANNRRWIVAGVVGFGVLAIVSSSALDLFDLDDQLSERMQDLSSQGRMDLWANSLSQSQYWATGSGMGTYRFAIMPANPMTSSWPLHAESIYVETAVEFGWVGFLLVVVALVWLLVQLSPSTVAKSSRMWPAALYSLLAVAVQSFVDFSLIIPAIFIPLLVVIGVYLTERFEIEGGRTSIESVKGRLPAVLILIGLAVIGWSGYQSLQGFAQAETIEKEFKQSMIAAEADGRLDSEQTSKIEHAGYDYSHPEVVLALTRSRLATLERLVTNLPDWPKNLSLTEQKQLSSSEFISALLRSTPEDSVWKSRKEYFERFPMVASDLEACNAGFQFASRACKLDWRSAWGKFQTLVKPDPKLDGINWSRLNLLCGSVFNTNEVLGTCCIIAGERKLGVESWKSVVVRNPKRASELSKLVGTLLSADDVLDILPDHPIATAELSRSLFTQPESKDVANRLLQSLDFEEVLDAASDQAEWELVAWVSETSGNDEGLEKSLEAIAGLRPFDAMIRFRLAQHLEKQGRTAEAIKHLEQAARRTTLPVQVQAYLKDLQRSGPSSGG